jgi:hypothetical protein
MVAVAVVRGRGGPKHESDHERAAVPEARVSHDRVVRAIRYAAVWCGLSITSAISRSVDCRSHRPIESTQGVDMVRQHRTTAAVVITLALTASLPSTASADPAPLARAEAAIAAAHSSAPVVGPNHDEQAAIAAAHSSEPVVGPNPDEQAAIAAAHSSVPVGPNPDQQAAGSPSRATVHVSASNPGFDWDDAGIGAGATVLLLGVGLAGTRVATSTRKRRTRQERTIVAN